MINDARNHRKILLLSSQPQFFRAAKDVLNARGFETTDDVDADIDAAVLEPFFFHSGMTDYLRQVRRDIPILAICTSRHEDEISRIRFQADETIVLPYEDWRHPSGCANIREAFNQSQFLQILQCADREFGAGLWTFFMQQLITPSERFARFC